MDRRTRRYVPSSEGLEGRQLLSTATATAAAASAGTTSTLVNPATGSSTPAGTQIDGGGAVADTIAIKLQHIQNYPFFIGQLNRDGAVPQPMVANIQNDLRAMVGTLHAGDSATIRQFNLDLRGAQNTYNILPSTAQALNRDFGASLLAAGANPQITADLQNQMNQLVQAASSQPTPSIVVRNEYATTLQLALGTGRPLLAPAKPRLASASRSGSVHNLDVTKQAEPSLSGTYAANTNIQIVDANNTVFGAGATDVNGNYTVKFANPLPNGTYTVRVRAEDTGYFSPPSKTYTFVVDVKTPKTSATTR